CAPRQPQLRVAQQPETKSAKQDNTARRASLICASRRLQKKIKIHRAALRVAPALAARRAETRKNSA
ncbi:hypothetical protein A2U01_0113298, partial [Trifolium medium]|nr:hypothetical protein [Trifolium medium]